MKIAIVHEWLTIIGGSEKVFVEITKLYPAADIFTLVSDSETIKKLELQHHSIHTSFIQNLPFAKTKYRLYFPLFPLAVEQFDLSPYDLIISSSHSVAKGVLTNCNQIHICYCHSPVRYAWDLYHQYMRESGLNKGFKGVIAKYFLHHLRLWDFVSSNRVDYFIANSNYIGKRIKKVYNRESVTIYPNVATENFELSVTRDNYYFTCSRFVPYKKIDLIVQAFGEMLDKELYIIGDGPDFDKIKKIATSNVHLLGYQSFEVLKKYMAKAKAFIFAAEEDFGITPVEAQSSGTPVIAFGKGGVLETVVNGKTGLFFYEQSAKSIINAISNFEKNISLFNHYEISEHAKLYSQSRFREEFETFVESVLNKL